MVVELEKQKGECYRMERTWSRKLADMELEKENEVDCLLLF